MRIFYNSSPHGRSFQFTRKNPALFQDNSLDSASRVKSVLETREKNFLNKKTILKNLINRKQKIRLQQEAEVKFQVIVERNLKLYYDLKNRESCSAVVIQKWVRGFLVRKKNRLKFDQRVKESAKDCVENMHRFIYGMWIDFKYFLKPARVIEDHYIRYKARKRLVCIQELYVKYCFYKKAERLRIFEYLSYLSIRSTLWELKQPLVLKRKLENIRQNLSFLKLKRFLQRNNLSAVKITAKIRKFKALNTGEKKLKKTRSFSKGQFASPFAWRYSMVGLPIEYSEDILLGSEVKNSRKRKLNNFNNRDFKILRKRSSRFRDKVNHSSSNFPNIRTNDSLYLKSRSPQFLKFPGYGITDSSKTSIVSGTKPRLEIITYHSPVSESLGYKSFGFKIWKPIFGKITFQGSVTPKVQRTALLKPNSETRHSSLIRRQ